MNPIEAKLEEALNKVLVPGTMRSLVQMNLIRSMGEIIAVMSGKGGVGKSLVVSLLYITH
jgi:Mrp family chromosome partitioning ATPase